jgi:hypothetical protein
MAKLTIAECANGVTDTLLSNVEHGSFEVFADTFKQCASGLARMAHISCVLAVQCALTLA